jgi:ribosomal protein L21E
MSKYSPDNWAVLKLTFADEPGFCKVLAGWSGGYAQGDSWRLNSGVTKVEKDGDYYNFHGASGSIYQCHKDSYGLRMNIAGIYQKIVNTFPEQVTMLDETTDWTKLV